MCAFRMNICIKIHSSRCLSQNKLHHLIPLRKECNRRECTAPKAQGIAGGKRQDRNERPNERAFDFDFSVSFFFFFFAFSHCAFPRKVLAAHTLCSPVCYSVYDSILRFSIRFRRTCVCVWAPPLLQVELLISDVVVFIWHCRLLTVRHQPMCIMI